MVMTVTDMSMVVHEQLETDVALVVSGMANTEASIASEEVSMPPRQY